MPATPVPTTTASSRLNGPAPGRDRDGEPGGAAGGRRRLEPRALEQLEREPCAAHALARERDRRRLEVRACGIEVRRVGEAELHVHRCGDADDLGHLVQADEAAHGVGRLDVQVDRNVNGRADRRQLRERQIGHDVERVGPERDEHPRRAGFATGKTTDTLACMSGEETAGHAHGVEDREEPGSAIRTLRKP